MLGMAGWRCASFLSFITFVHYFHMLTLPGCAFLLPWAPAARLVGVKQQIDSHFERNRMLFLRKNYCQNLRKISSSFLHLNP